MQKRSLDVQKSKGPDFIKKFDFLLMLAVLAISAVGLAFLHSAQYDKYIDHGKSAMIGQAVGLTIGIIASLLICSYDYGNMRRIYKIFYAANLLLMLAVFVPGLGQESGGSRSWLKFGPVTYQPAELMKLAMIIFVSYYIEKADKDGMTMKNALGIIGGFAVPLGLVVLQKDMGMAIVYVLIFLVMIFVGKIKLRYILGILGGGLLLVPFAWKFYLNGVRRVRFLGFLDPENPMYYDYTLQLRRSLTAIGSGGLFGKGIGNGPMNTSNKILVKLTDMIFTVICEEAGFVGALLVIFLFAFIFFRMLHIANKASDMFGKCIAVGVFTMLSVTTFQNIAMNIGLMPITGLPLPFVSQGGSAMITNYVAVGFVLSVSMRRRGSLFED